MSEEAIKTAQQFVDSLQVLSEECDSATEILAATLDDHSGAREILVAHMAQQLDTFAAQVCEQREKLSSKLTPSEWLRENGFGDSAVASDLFDKDGDPHTLIGLMDE